MEVMEEVIQKQSSGSAKEVSKKGRDNYNGSATNEKRKNGTHGAQQMTLGKA
jgi:hypothetical protein